MTEDTMMEGKKVNSVGEEGEEGKDLGGKDEWRKQLSWKRGKNGLRNTKRKPKGGTDGDKTNTVRKRTATDVTQRQT